MDLNRMHLSFPCLLLKISVIALLTIQLTPNSLRAQKTVTDLAATNGNPKIDLMDQKSFVENWGQFDERVPGATYIKYGFEGDGQQVFLSRNKIYFNLYRAKLREKTPEEKARRKARKKAGFCSPEAYTAFEKAGKKFDYTTDLLETEWVNANPDPDMVGSEMDQATHTYEWGSMYDLHSRSGIHSYQKITYKDLYPGIDVEYTLHPQSGIKYSLIVHPGADISQVKLHYSKEPELLSNGTITTLTRFGEILDHAPITFYQSSKTAIPSAYLVNGNEISFSIGQYDHNQTIVIDPWTDLPNDPSTNWNCAWECETDALGNSYAIYGAMPLRLRKYNALGAIQWTYNTTYDTTSWLGTFVTDDAGNSYVTNGSTAALRKVSPAGALLWSVGNITGQLLGEFWNIAFNCDQTRLVTGGAGGAFNPEPYIYEVNTVNGALVSSVQVHQGTGLFNPSEVRGITATENAKYYWLTHDSIGFLSQSFAACPSSGSEFIAHSGYGLSYKCENWRYNNTGIEAIAYHNGFVYVNRGNRIDKRDVNTAAIVATATIPGGAFTSQFGGNYVENSGIVIDNLGRIFVGSRGSVSEFNTNLALIGTYPVTGGYNVYDVDLTSTGELIACGASGNSGSASRSGTVESLGVLGAGPYAMACCDASICPIETLCDDDAPVTLVASGGGGTLSSTAPGFNPATGVFDPSVAGVGTYTFYNTVPCGMDSLVIDVIFCSGLSVCVLPNGDLSVSGGGGSYTWEEGTMVTTCPFGPGSGCNFLTHAVNTLTWTTIGTGVSVTPPAGADTVRVSDGTIENISYDIGTLPPCGPLPAELTHFEGWPIGAVTNRLQWTTASELNVHHYTLQRSSDGIEFEFVGTTPGKGTSYRESVYTMDDPHASTPTTYYKLGTADLNGTFRHLSTIVVHRDQPQEFIYNLYPNPAHDQIHFTYTGPGSEQGDLQLSVVDGFGRIVMENEYPSPAHNSSLNVDVSGLASGVYQMVFIVEGQRSTRKVMIFRD